MQTHAFEFVRIADPDPATEKVDKRKTAAADIVNIISQKQNREILLGCVQGVVAGFGSGFGQASPVVTTVLNAIKNHDAAFPNELSENNQELRACAAIAIGGVLTQTADKESAMVAALALRSVLGLRPASREKHVRFAIDKLQPAAEALLTSVATNRRLRTTTALRKLNTLEQPEDQSQLWKTVMPAVRAVFREVHAQSVADREEIDTLWWMFQHHSEVARKSLDSMPAAFAGLCAGIELADRAVIPPLSAHSEFIRRAVEAGRKPADLKGAAISEIVTAWPKEAIETLVTSNPSLTPLYSAYPSLFPVTKVCSRILAVGKFSKDAITLTGLSATQEHSASEWGQQVFNERVLQRVLVESGS